MAAVHCDRRTVWPVPSEAAVDADDRDRQVALDGAGQVLAELAGGDRAAHALVRDATGG